MTGVACHNAYEKSPQVLAMRVAQGVGLGKQWQQHQLMAALSISVQLDKAELLGTWCLWICKCLSWEALKPRA
jgi:hypothetical protein